MSIINAFDGESPEIIRSDCMASPVEGFPKTVILTFKSSIIDILTSICDVETISSVYSGITIPIYKFRYKEAELGIYRTLLGGPGSVGLMEEVIVKGAERFLVFGSCGVLDRQIITGHYIIPTAAYRDEGTSYHYMPAGDWVEIPTSARLGEVFDELMIPYVFGKTWTTDAFYRETHNKVEARKKDGCITVEMECASLAAASQFRGVPLYQYLYAEDCLDGDFWDPRTMGKLPVCMEERHLRVALEAASRL